MTMSDRVHPSDSPPSSNDNSKPPYPPPTQPPRSSNPVYVHHRSSMSQESMASKDSYPYSTSSAQSGPAPGTYIVQIPKDQIYRTPPPENAYKFEQYTRKKQKNKSCCRCCIFTFLFIIILFAALIATTMLVLFLVYRPKVPAYSIQTLSAKGINLNSTMNAISRPDVNLTMRFENRNSKIGIWYEEGNDMGIYYNGNRLGDGTVPPFYQTAGNVTLVEAELVGAGIVFAGTERTGLVVQQAAGKVPLTLKVTMPVRLKVGSLKTGKVTLKVICQVTVSGLTAEVKVVTEACNVSVNPW